MDFLISGKSRFYQESPLSAHRDWEIIANLEGTGKMRFDGGISVPFDDSFIVCIPPDCRHEKRSEEGFRDLWIQTSDFPGLDKTRPTFLSDDGERSITSLMNMLYTVQYRREPNSQIVAESLLDSIRQMILFRIRRKPTDARVERIVNTIISSFQDADFSLDDCLCADGYCADHMRRLFREQIGKTPHEYLNDLRLRTAKRLLLSCDSFNYPVAAICAQSGFSDPAYFSRIFKKETGLSPIEFIKEERAEDGQ